MQVNFYPYEKEGRKKGHAEGGTKCFRVVLTQDLEVLAILKAGVQKTFHLLKRGGGGGGGERFYIVLTGVRKVSDPRFFYFVAPPPPSLPCY